MRWGPLEIFLSEAGYGLIYNLTRSFQLLCGHKTDKGKGENKESNEEAGTGSQARDDGGWDQEGSHERCER